METIDIEIGRLRERLQGQELKTVIIPHISADGDAVGACSAFSEALLKAGFDCHILTCDYFPEYLVWLKNIKRAISYQNKHR